MTVQERGLCWCANCLFSQKPLDKQMRPRRLKKTLNPAKFTHQTRLPATLWEKLYFSCALAQGGQRPDEGGVYNKLAPPFIFIHRRYLSTLNTTRVKGQLKPKAIHSIQCILRGPGPWIVSLLKMSFQKWLNCDYARQIDLARSLER